MKCDPPGLISLLLEDFMRCLNFFALFLIAGLINVGSSTSMARGQTKQLESPQMGIVVNVPEGWKVAPNEVNPTAEWGNGAAKLVLLHFEKQWLFEVMHPEKTAANFAPALDNAKIVDDEQAVINELVGAKATGTGRLHGKPVQFKCVIVGDRDNSKPNTLVVIVVASEGAMKQQSRQIASALDSVRAKNPQ
jgi:hypothetical protein